MALKKARNVAVETKKPTSAAAPNDAGGMAANNLNPPRLPPGVYFIPSREESVGFLNRWIAASREIPAAARRFISQSDIYGNSPDAMRRMHPPASARAGQHTWWFLSDTRFQSPGAAKANKRADRKVDTGGYWRLEQRKRKLGDDGGLKNSFSFYLGSPNKGKTPWLMQELTSDKDEGAGKKGVPALHKLYVTPYATDDQLRGIYGEDGVKVSTNGAKKPVPAAVPAGYFDAIAALLSPGSARGVGREHVEVPQASQPPSPLAPAALLHHDGLQGHYFMGEAMPANVLGQYQQQQGHYSMGGAMPANVLGQYQQKPGHYSMGMGVAPPPASPAPPGLFDDNLSIPVDQLMAIIDEEPE